MRKTGSLGGKGEYLSVDPSAIRGGTFLPGWEGMDAAVYEKKVEKGLIAYVELQAYADIIDSTEKMEKVKIMLDNMLQGCPREVSGLVVIDTKADKGTGKVAKYRGGRESWSLQDAMDFWGKTIDPEARFQSPPEEVEK